MQAIWAIAAKDLRIEVRSKSTASAVLPFAITMLLALGFALGPSHALLQQSAPGLLWLAGLFASVELFARSYQLEADHGALEGLLLAPVDKGAIFLGKAASAAVQLLLLMGVSGLLVAVLFDVPLPNSPALLLLTALLGVTGLSAVGSLLGLLTVLGRTRRAALPVLVLPLVSPVLIAATRSTALLTVGSTGDLSGWLALLAAFDAAFLATGYLVFAHVLED